uniref:cDNA FLJ43689 fis, clone TBAES2003550 n=1 Tax=Homo sapiens TaxID=9606 RepID=Q6ZUI3_HUMAN|nr:unnamed protein product [Homo sapiens]
MAPEDPASLRHGLWHQRTQPLAPWTMAAEDPAPRILDYGSRGPSLPASWTKAPEDPAPSGPGLWQQRTQPLASWTMAPEDPASLRHGLWHQRTQPLAPWTMAAEDPAPWRPGLRHSRTPQHRVLLHRRTLAGLRPGLSY